ncbi:hypothetical protein ABIE41_003461 [Bosea sp. OAE506]|uniref:hypothetical protein n=1 Tax=Bosea sp. OAE506 TaxID=2663870 RepID=UPI001789E6AC
MSALSRLPPDVRRAVAGWRWGREEEQRKHIRGAHLHTRAQMIGEIQRLLDTADRIALDVQHCRYDRDAHPIRRTINAMQEGDKLTMLRAAACDIRRLLDDLGLMQAGR